VQPRESLAAFVVRVGFRIAVVAMLVLAAAHLGNEFVLDGRVEGLDADVEGNVFTWASSTATFAVAFCAALHAAAVEKQRREFTVLAALTLWFSMDDVAIIHERVAHKIGEDLFGLSDAIAVRLWLILYLPLLVLAALVLWRIADEAQPPAGRSVRLGLGLLVASIPVEIVGALTRELAEEGTNVPNELRIALEEGLELGGWILVAAGLTAILCSALMRTAPTSQ
jgi:hypothetical protein